MIPTQTRTVDPYSSYHSDNVNRLTRLLTDGLDKIARDEHLEAFGGTSSSGIVFTHLVNDVFGITDGLCIKDDVLINIVSSDSSGFHEFDLNDEDNYIFTTGTIADNIDSTAVETYLVLTYQYVKQINPNRASIKILFDTSQYNSEDHLFLAKITINRTSEVRWSAISQNDGDIVRPVLNLTDAYTDQDARDAQALNRITNHLPADDTTGNERGRVVVTDSVDGHVKLVTYSDIVGGGSQNNLLVQWDGSAVEIAHGQGIYPKMDIIDATTFEVISGIVTHIDTAHFTIDFDPLTSNPYTVYVVF